MKKTLLSGFIITAFILFSFFQRRVSDSNISIQQPPTHTPTDTNTPSTETAKTSQAISKYKDGEYTGDVADAFYGNIQVKAVIQNGKITDVVFLQYPNDRDRSIEINTQAMPILKQEAIQTQKANVDIVSGATDTSKAFNESLTSALVKAI